MEAGENAEAREGGDCDVGCFRVRVFCNIGF